MAKRILIACDLGEPFKKKLQEAGFELSLVPSREGLAEALKGIHGLFIGARFRFTAELLEQADSLEAISFCGVGVGTYVDQEAATRRGIAVMNAPGVNAVAVAEYAVSFLLALRKVLVRENNALKAGMPFRAMNFEIQGMKIGILGMGHVGSRIAAILHHGFRTPILYASRTRKPQAEEDFGARFVDFRILLAESDALFLALPETEATHGMIGASELAQMKKSALLINVARPGLVDGHALREALSSGTIRGAAFDGYYLSNPYPRVPEEDTFGLLSLPDECFLCTPHIASRSQQVWDDLFERAAQNLIEFFNTGSCTHIVNPGCHHHRRP
ncbi:MAG: hypothetical protein JXB25_04225 [Deltaproteobacteria bacterium]|nr:hypothetical protein [Deltaproteobacteria bacterium]